MKFIRYVAGGVLLSKGKIVGEILAKTGIRRLSHKALMLLSPVAA
ncbi:hypothetical protein [Sporomusa sphaeroides]|nr:hypothetical protein [Sporomusa sphaeroides]HML34916.1 hypothetical protein [Sporomusa sphaeroides]